jgi:hypothetical protein
MLSFSILKFDLRAFPIAFPPTSDIPQLNISSSCIASLFAIKFDMAKLP